MKPPTVLYVQPPTVLYVRRSEVHGNPPTDDSFRIVLAMDAEAYQGQLQARVEELKNDNRQLARQRDAARKLNRPYSIRIEELEERIETLQTTDDHRTLYAEAQVRELREALQLLVESLLRTSPGHLDGPAGEKALQLLALVPANEETAE